jgi:hypothetical protein
LLPCQITVKRLYNLNYEGGEKNIDTPHFRNSRRKSLETIT